MKLEPTHQSFLFEVRFNILSDTIHEINILKRIRRAIIKFLILNRQNCQTMARTLWHNLIYRLEGFIMIEHISFQSNQNYREFLVMKFHSLFENLRLPILQIIQKEQTRNRLFKKIKQSDGEIYAYQLCNARS